MKLKQYPKYKKSDLPWLELIPEHWHVLPNRAIFEDRNTRGMDNDDLLSVTIKRGVIRQKELVESTSKKDSSNDDKSKYKLVMQGDLPYNKMRMWQGAVGVSKYRGIVSPAYIILKPRENAYPDYFHYLLRTKEYTKESHRYSYGICDDQLSLRFKDFKAIKSTLPSLDEQKTIASFLRTKEKKIIQFIRNKRRLIQLLKEQKQAIINQAVTRGINHDVKMKQSGIDWIGDIPEHWKCFKLKRLVRFGPSKSELGDQVDMKDIVDFLPMESISVGGKINCEQKHKVADLWNGFTYFKRNDVIMAKITPCFENGKGAYLDKLESDFGFGTTELIVMRPLKSIRGDFLYYLTMTSQFRKDGREFMTGAAGQKRVPVDFVKNYVVGLPPLIDEQTQIVNYINKKHMEIESIIEKTIREIELIQEYRTRLISDVVTGKVDVRNIKVVDIDREDMEDYLPSTDESEEVDVTKRNENEEEEIYV